MSRGDVVVVGAGIAGLAAAHALQHAPRVRSVVVLEAARRPGGLIETERVPQGFVVEHGADCLVTGKPEGIRAARALGLDAEICTGPGPRRSFLAVGTALVPIPPVFEGPTRAAVASMLRTPLLSPAAKLRLALEPLCPRLHTPDESIAAFLDRRYGCGFRTGVAAPLLAGVYGGPAEVLSAEACLPRLRQFEREDGSVTRGMRRAIRAQRRHSAARHLPATVTLRGGMATLPGAFARQLGDRLALGVTVRCIARAADERFLVDTSRGRLICDGVVVAVPAWRAAELLEGLDADLAEGLAAVRHAAFHCVTLAWPERAVGRALDGTGFVTPTRDRRATRACTWSSRKWPDRAPVGHVLMRSVLRLSDDPDPDVVMAARRDLRDLLGVSAPPLFSRVRRLARATPIYEVGHLVRAAALQARARAHGALALAGNAWQGIGIPDCIRAGETAAHTVSSALRQPG